MLPTYLTEWTKMARKRQSIWGLDPGFERAAITIANSIMTKEQCTGAERGSDTLVDTLICTARKLVQREMAVLESDWADWPAGGPR